MVLLSMYSAIYVQFDPLHFKNPLVICPNLLFKSEPVEFTNPNPYNLTLVVPLMLISLGYTSSTNGSKKPYV